MKKKKILDRKLTLQRETLRGLEGAQLQEAAGAYTLNGSCCNSSCDTETVFVCYTRNCTANC